MYTAGVSRVRRKSRPIGGLKARRFDPDVAMGLHAKRHCPENSLGVARIDVIVHDDDHLGPHRRGFMASVENLNGLARFGIVDLNAAQPPASRRLMEGDTSYISELALQKREDVAFGPGAANFA